MKSAFVSPESQEVDSQRDTRYIADWIRIVSQATWDSGRGTVASSPSASDVGFVQALEYALNKQPQ